MFRALVTFNLALWLAWCASVCAAEGLRPVGSATQVTTGDNSPAIFAPQARSVETNVTVYQVDAARLARELKGREEAQLREAANLLERGKLQEAQRALESAEEKLAPSLAQAAFLRHAQGTVAAARGLPHTAERAFAAAVAIAPTNCAYRARWALALSQLDRIPEATLQTEPSNPAAATCLRGAADATQGALHGVLMRIAIEARDSTKALMHARQAAAAYARHARRSNHVSWTDAVWLCAFANVAAETRLEGSRNERATDLNAVCADFSVRAAASDALVSSKKGDPEQVAQLVSANIGNKAGRFDEIARLGQLIEIATQAPQIGQLGFDEEARNVYVGSLTSERGFLILWSAAPDPKQVRGYYLAARKLLESIASPHNPNALHSYIQLLVRARQFDEIYRSDALAWDYPQLFSQALSMAVEVDFEPYYEACEALLHVERYARTDTGFQASAAAVTRLQVQRARCVTQGLQAGSLRHVAIDDTLDEIELQVLDAAKRDLEAVGVVTRMIDRDLARRGFPIHTELRGALPRRLHHRAVLNWRLGLDEAARRDFAEADRFAQSSGQSVEAVRIWRDTYHHALGRLVEQRQEHLRIATRWAELAQTQIGSRSRAAGSDADASTSCLTLLSYMEAAHARASAGLAAARWRTAREGMGQALDVWGEHRNCSPPIGDRHGFNEAVSTAIKTYMIDLRIARESMLEGDDSDDLRIDKEVLSLWLKRLESAGVVIDGNEKLHITQEFRRVSTSLPTSR